MKADLHVHSCYSFDCGMSLETIVKQCTKRGINCVAIADHGTIAGALRLREMAPFKVIVAEEVLTPAGEIMGVFLEQEVPSGIPVEEAFARIKDQGALVCIPHPFDYMRGINQKVQPLESLVPNIDIIEVYNARALALGTSNKKARLFAEKHGLLHSAGSDAHTSHEIGHAYVEMPDFEGKDEYRSALAQGTIHGHRTCPLVHVPTTSETLVKQIRKRLRR